jgi:hypothetical protein
MAQDMHTMYIDCNCNPWALKLQSFMITKRSDGTRTKNDILHYYRGSLAL